MSGRRGHFGELLRTYREAAGYSQEALAERAELSANAISAIERGERKRPYPDTIRRLAEALGLDDAQRVAFAVAASRKGAGAIAEPAKSSRVPDSLPGEPTPLIGREPEVEVVHRLLVEESGRPLTLTGPGGVGKTRLALHVAREASGQYPDGVVWVELAGLGEPHLVLPTIARQAGMEEALGPDGSAALHAFLGSRRLLLVLDNAEHLLDAAADIAAILRACPDIGMLVTSRAPLNIRGEQEYVVPPLPLPTAGQLHDPANLAGVPAVQLFVWLVRQKDPAFALGPDNAVHVAAICRRLDGVPLALELAAARVKVLGIPDLLARLDSALAVLTGGPADLPARQRTMEEAIRWSYDLLRPAEKMLFRQLAIFAGGWTLDAAEEVVSGDVDILDGMAALVNQSLIRQMGGPGDARRFTMLETLREFGLKQLTEHGELTAARASHVTWCTTLAETAEHELAGPGQVAWLTRLEAEHDNLRAALGSEDDELGEERLRLGGALWRFWWWHGHLTEGRSWLFRVLGSSAGSASPWRGKALAAAGILAREQGDYEQAQAFLTESLAIRQRIGDRRGTAQALNILGLVANSQGMFDRALDYFEQSLALYREDGYDLGIAHALNNFAGAKRDLGAFSEAIERYEECVGIYARLGEKRGLSGALHNLARAKRDVGAVEEALGLYARSLELERELGDRLNMGMTLAHLGRIAVDRGDDAGAARLFAESLSIRSEFGDKLGCVKAVEDIATLAARDDPESGVRLYGAAGALREALGSPLPPADCPYAAQLESALRDRLGQERFDIGLATGRRMNTAQAVDEARTYLRNAFGVD